MNKLKVVLANLKQKIVGETVQPSIVKEVEQQINVPLQDLIDLRLQLANTQDELAKLKKQNQVVATPEQLLQMQLGSYIPNFEPLENKDDNFKNSLGRLCREVHIAPEFQYLITHLKQDQVNINLFGERKNEDFVRGSINGIYIVAEQIELLAVGYIDRLNKGLIKDKPQPVKKA